MTSQYDIEMGINKLKRMDIKLNELKKIKKSTSLEKKSIKKLQKEFVDFNLKLSKWCIEFDSRVKPLPNLDECPNPDKIFGVRIPKHTPDHQKLIAEYNQFIKKEGYKVKAMDKQFGYLTIVYTFFTEKSK